MHLTMSVTHDFPTGMPDLLVQPFSGLLWCLLLYWFWSLRCVVQEHYAKHSNMVVEKTVNNVEFLPHSLATLLFWDSISHWTSSIWAPASWSCPCLQSVICAGDTALPQQGSISEWPQKFRFREEWPWGGSSCSLLFSSCLQISLVFIGLFVSHILILRGNWRREEALGFKCHGKPISYHVCLCYNIICLWIFECGLPLSSFARSPSFLFPPMFPFIATVCRLLLGK